VQERSTLPSGYVLKTPKRVLGFVKLPDLSCLVLLPSRPGLLDLRHLTFKIGDTEPIATPAFLGHNFHLYDLGRRNKLDRHPSLNDVMM
jgi:hypothetical protein